ncbi:MAG TPA: ATP-binding cassette domain-containing protein [Vicinamibacterales bacterium]
MKTAIRADHLRKEFGDFVAVHDISLDVYAGSSFALLGPNGAGKSTLIRMLTTLVEPTAGRAFVAGHDVVREPDVVRRAIGVIPQALTSDPELTAAENLEFYAGLYSVPRRQWAELVTRLLEVVNLTAWRDRMVGTFSGGMRRRLEIARSLIHRPEVLFLDEPTTGLDPASRHAMWEMIRELQQSSGLTLFLTTHYMEEADELCDGIAICDHGRIVASGSPAELKREVGGRTLEDVFIAFTGRALRDAADGDGRLDVRHFYDRTMR